MSKLDPEHYNRWKIQPLDFITENNLDFLRGNIIKYIMRYDAKDGINDLQKALVYLNKLIQKEERYGINKRDLGKGFKN